MRTVAWETAFHLSLVNHSQEVGEKVSIYVILVKGEYIKSTHIFADFCWSQRVDITMKGFSAFLDMIGY